MKVKSVQEIGDFVRKRRKSLKLTQKDLAGLIGVGNRFIVDLEAGKETVETGKVLLVLKMLGIMVILEPK